jgi:hypothetical protein
MIERSNSARLAKAGVSSTAGNVHELGEKADTKLSGELGRDAALCEVLVRALEPQLQSRAHLTVLPPI